MAGVYDVVQMPRVPRSVFDLSYKRIMTGDMMKLIPCYLQECVPGDRMQVATELVIRFQPLLSPVLHEINAFVNYFFVPYRLLWDDWESFITGGEDGTEAPTMPTWNPGGVMTRGSLWDYLGFPTGVNVNTNGRPIDMPRRAYAKIYNDYFRAQEIISEVSETQTDVLNAANDRDYLSTALLWQQRGTAPGLDVSLSGTLDVMGTGTAQNWYTSGDATLRNMTVTSNDVRHGSTSDASLRLATDSNAELISENVSAITVAGFDIADFRLAFQTQKFLERNARAGARLGEFIQAHFRVVPEDSRLQKPEYIGGFRAPVIVSEVLQTESGDATTPLGEMGGHAMAVNSEFIGSVSVKEHGLIMGILCVKPRPLYSQGVDREWLRYTRLDFYFPEFAHLSEQGVLGAEIAASSTDSENTAIFGYQGRYNEMRSRRDLVGGQIRRGGDFDHWTFCPATPTATLNQAYLEAAPSTDPLTSSSDPHFFVVVGNRVKAVRPLPYFSTPS